MRHERSGSRGDDRRPAKASQSGSKERRDSIAEVHRQCGNRAVQRAVTDGLGDERAGAPAGESGADRESGGLAVDRSTGAESSVDSAPDGPRTRPAKRMCSRCARRYRAGKRLDCEECEAVLQRSTREPGTAVTVDGNEVQPKLAVSDPGDSLEREAERVAERVLRTDSAVEESDSPTTAQDPVAVDRARSNRGTRPLRGGTGCSKCADKLPVSGPLTVHLRSSTGGSGTVSGGLEEQIRSVRSGGRQLPDSVRSYFEPRFGKDFSNVRIHTGPEADRTARSINAEAFTVGNDVVFRRGEYAPGTPGGKRLLAHELAHVVQQGAAREPGNRADGRTGSRALRQTGDEVVQRSATASLGIGTVLAWCLSGAATTVGFDALSQGFVGILTEGEIAYNTCRGAVSALFGCVFGMVGGAVATGLARMAGVSLSAAGWGQWVAIKLKTAGYTQLAGKWTAGLAKLGCDDSTTYTLYELSGGWEALQVDKGAGQVVGPAHQTAAGSGWGAAAEQDTENLMDAVNQARRR